MKKSNHSIAMTIKVTPEAAWSVIGAVSGVNNWFAPITACRVDGDKRYCTTEAGEFSEDIIKVDHENREFHYGIPVQNMVPVQNIIGLMKVTEAENGNATINWTWEFDVEEANEATAKESLNMAGTVGIQGIEQLILEGARA